MMEKSKQIKTKLAKVVEILTSMPEARDSDRVLIAWYWRWEQPLVCTMGSAEKLLRALENREISNPDDITRARRKAQELHPELRGSRYKERGKLQDEVTENINVPECQHPAEKQQPYHDGAVVCTACNCIISQYGNKFNPPVKLSMMP
jgi:hypothetical protein